MLRCGGALETFLNEGLNKWVSESVTAVLFEGKREVKANQPIWGSDEEGWCKYRRALDMQVALGRGEIFVIGETLWRM